MNRSDSHIFLDGDTEMYIVRKDLLAITGDASAAGLLNDIMYWSKARLLDGVLMEAQNKIRVEGGLLPIELDDWIYRSYEEFVEDCLGMLGRRKVIDSLDLLMEKGFVERRHNPQYGWDRKWQYRLNVTAINDALRKCIVPNAQMHCSKPHDAFAQTASAIQENINVKQTASQFVAAKSVPSEPVQAAVSEREPTEQQAMFEAIATVCHKDGKIKSVAARIGKCASELVKAGYLPQQIIDFEKWWLSDRWRAANTPIPTYAQLLDSIAVSVAAAAAEVQHNKASAARPDPPMQARARELRQKMVQNGQLISEV